LGWLSVAFKVKTVLPPVLSNAETMMKYAVPPVTGTLFTWDWTLIP
jgi:hypothetical protein